MNFERHHEEGHEDHEGHDEEGSDCSMIMTFHFGKCETILFKSLKVTTVEELISAVCIIFLVSILYEGLKFWREKLYNDYTSETAVVCSSIKASTSQLTEEQVGPRVQRKSLRELLMNRIHFLQTLMHLLQVTVSYSLMLIVMTYNVWLLLAVVFRAAFGYYLFGWIRQRSIDIAEHCH